MRFNQVKYLVRLFFMYFLRKVVSAGILRNPLFKILLGLSLVTIFIATSGLMYLFFSEIGNESQEVDLILKVYSNTIVLWTMIIFIFLKILFSKSNKFLNMTLTLPITMKERNMALLLFEILMTFLLISIISFSITFALLLLYGIQYFGMLISNIFYLSLSLYLIMQMFYLIFGIVLEKIRLSKIKLPLLFIIFTSYFFVFYNLSIEISSNILVSYLEKKESPKYTSLIWDTLYSYLGFWNTSLIFLVVVILLIFALMHIPDRAYFQQNNFYKLFCFSNQINYLFTYILTMLRRIENLNLVLIVYLAFFYTLYFKSSGNLLWPILIFCINGIYIYVQTDEIRFLQYKIEYSVIKDYFYLILSQLTWGGIFSLPIFIFILIKGNTFSELLYFYGIYLFSVILFTMIGILFPPRKENPFSVFLSFIIVLILFSLIGVSLFILNLSQQWNRFIIFFVLIASLIISIQGLIKLKEEYHDEENISIV